MRARYNGFITNINFDELAAEHIPGHATYTRRLPRTRCACVKENRYFFERKKIAAAFNLNKCLKQIK